MNKHILSSFSRMMFVLLSFLLLSILAACGTQPGTVASSPSGSGSQTTPVTQQTQTTSVASTSTPPTPAQTVPMPPTQTSCPTDGTARAAVMKPLVLGTHQNVVYIYNEIPLNTSTAYGHILRYDVSSGKKTEVVTSGISILHAQVSADGQWVMFLSQPDPRGDTHHSAMLQLVRMDGQGLQTLYCLPAVHTPVGAPSFGPNVQWSTDQQSALIATDTNNTTSTITLLHLMTGALQTELNITDNQQLYAYTLVTWLDNTRAYVTKVGRQGPQPPTTLYIMDVTKNNGTQGGSLQQVMTYPARFNLVSIDSNYDGTKLYKSDCLVVSDPFDTTITVGPVTGGAQQTIYHRQHDTCLQDLRVVTPQTLLMIAQINTNPNTGATKYQMWSMRPDGSGQKVLTDLSNTPSETFDLYLLNRFTQFPWSNVSRDKSMYVLESYIASATHSTLYVASLNGGTPTVFADVTRGRVDMAGWTTM